MLKENMSKKVRNVLSVAAISAAIVPFAVNAAAPENTITESKTVAGGTYSELEINATDADITVNLGGSTVTLKDNGLSVGANANSKKIVITNGKIVCGKDNQATDCVGAGVELENVSVSVAEGNTTTTNLVESTVKMGGTVTGPIALTANLADGATLIVDDKDATLKAANTFDFTTGSSAVTAKDVTIDLSKVNFNKEDAGAKVYTPANAVIKYSTANVKEVKAIPSYFENTSKALNADNKTYTYSYKIAALNTDKFDELTKAGYPISEEKAKEMYEQYKSEFGIESNVKDADSFMTWYNSLSATGLDARDQADFDAKVSTRNNMIAGKALNSDDKKQTNDAKAPENKDNNAQQVADVKSEDNVATKNPKTADSILSYVGLAISSLAGLGVAAKKYLFK